MAAVLSNSKWLSLFIPLIIDLQVEKPLDGVLNSYSYYPKVIFVYALLLAIFLFTYAPANSIVPKLWLYQGYKNEVFQAVHALLKNQEYFFGVPKIALECDLKIYRRSYELATNSHCINTAVCNV